MCAQACIDQLNIEESLACLPVFLAGCKQLLVLAGQTYSSRLWVGDGHTPQHLSPARAHNTYTLPLSCAFVCPHEAPSRGVRHGRVASLVQCVMEWFVFIQMGGQREAITVKLLDTSTDLLNSLRRFDAAKAKCYLDMDRHSLLGVIEAHFGTCAPFNAVVRRIIAERLDSHAEPPSRRRSSTRRRSSAFLPRRLDSLEVDLVAHTLEVETVPPETDSA